MAISQAGQIYTGITNGVAYISIGDGATEIKDLPKGWINNGADDDVNTIQGEAGYIDVDDTDKEHPIISLAPDVKTSLTHADSALQASHNTATTAHTDIRNAIPTAVTKHNTATDAHSDIRSTVTSNAETITSLQGIIPAEASATNKLADKAFVDAEIYYTDLPDHAHIETINQMASSTSWTSDRNGYVQLGRTNGNIGVRNGFIINGTVVWSSNINVDETIEKVKIGDVIEFFEDDTSAATLTCFYIPPVRVITADSLQGSTGDSYVDAQIINKVLTVTAKQATKDSLSKADSALQPDDILTLENTVATLKGLGHKAGTYPTFADVPTNASGFPGGITPNDFVAVENENCYYDATAIGSDGAITWTKGITYSTDVTGMIPFEGKVIAAGTYTSFASLIAAEGQGVYYFTDVDSYTDIPSGITLPTGAPAQLQVRTFNLFNTGAIALDLNIFGIGRYISFGNITGSLAGWQKIASTSDLQKTLAVNGRSQVIKIGTANLANLQWSFEALFTQFGNYGNAQLARVYGGNKVNTTNNSGGIVVVMDNIPTQESVYQSTFAIDRATGDIYAYTGEYQDLGKLTILDSNAVTWLDSPLNVTANPPDNTNFIGSIFKESAMLDDPAPANVLNHIENQDLFAVVAAQADNTTQMYTGWNVINSPDTGSHFTFIVKKDMGGYATMEAHCIYNDANAIYTCFSNPSGWSSWQRLAKTTDIIDTGALTGVDLNDYTNTFMGGVSGNCANLPGGWGLTGDYYGVFTNYYGTGKTDSREFCQQILIHEDTGMTFRRTSNQDGTVWTPWTKLGGINYSTAEQLTGDTWVDGSPIYQKTFTKVLDSTSTQTTSYISMAIASRITYYEVKGGCITSAGGNVGIPINVDSYTPANHFCEVRISNNSNGADLYFEFGQILDGATAVVTIRYAKAQ